MTEIEACYCLAVEHGLWTNCLNCGKVLCRLEEQYKRCTFCSTPISAKSLRALDSSEPLRTKKGTIIAPVTYKSKVNLHSQGIVPADRQREFPEINEALKKAEERKQTLLNYDRNDTQRSQIKDLTADFDSAYGDKWLTPSQKAALLKEHQIRKKALEDQKNRYTIDFGSQSVFKDEHKYVLEIPMVSAPKAQVSGEDDSDLMPKGNFVVEEGEVAYIGNNDMSLIGLKQPTRRYNVVQQNFGDEEE